MPRIIVVKKCRTDQGSCGRCGDKLPAGSPYRHWSFRFGGKRKRCMKPACSPRPSDLTQSKLSGAYAARECVEDLLSEWDGIDWDSLKSDVESQAEEIRMVSEEYQEAFDAMGEGLQQSSTGEKCEEKAGELEDWASEIIDAIEGVEEVADESKRAEWVESVRDAVQYALDSCPV